MCTKNEEQSKSGRNGDENIKLKKQQMKYNSNDNPSVDFRIHTNIEFISDKKMKICLLINILVSVVCITTSFIICFKLYNQVLQVQSEMVRLNQRIDSLTERCEQKVEDHVMSQAEAQVSHGLDLDLDDKNKDGNYELMQQTHSRLPRANTNRRTKDKTTRRKVKSSGALAAHFKGSVPEIFIKDQGLVGPWYLDNSVSRQYKFPKFHLTEGQCSIEVTEPALYLIYAQVYYVTTSAVNSYSVVVRSEGSSENNIIAKCSAVGPKSHSAELSCYTATVHSLKANDRIFIQQTEKNRTIILRDGHSFFGLVRLNNSHSHRKT